MSYSCHVSGSGTFSGGSPPAPSMAVAPHPRAPRPAAAAALHLRFALSRHAAWLGSCVLCPVSCGIWLLPLSMTCSRSFRACPRGSVCRSHIPFCGRRVRSVDAYVGSTLPAAEMSPERVLWLSFTVAQGASVSPSPAWPVEEHVGSTSQD